MPAVLFAKSTNGLPACLLRGDPLPPNLRRCTDCFSHTRPPDRWHGCKSNQRRTDGVGGTHTVKQGYLNTDNNAAERALKRVAIGRKNWLFAGNDEAAANHARLYTLIASAQRHGLDPQAYLTSVLAKASSTAMSEVKQFLPDVWKADCQRESMIGAPIAVSLSIPAQ